MTPKVPDYGHRYTDKKLAALTKRLRRSYRQASLNLQEKISAYMEQFEKEDARMRALYDSGELSHEDYMAWRFRKIAGTRQWRDMLDQLTDDLVNADRIAAGMINDELPEVYAENHNYGTYEIERDLQMSTSYTLYNRDAVARLLKGNPDLLPQPRVDIPKDERWNRRHLQSAVLQGILTGEPMKDIAKRFENVAAMDERAAMRNARTAVTGAENAGKLDSMRRAISLGVQLQKLWLATRDSRTRDSHVIMDGEQVDVEEKFSNGCMYPGDPEGAPAEVYNCRCAMRSKVAGADPYSPDLSRNQRLGGMTYEEWKQQAIERIEEKEFKDAIADMRSKGLANLTRDDILNTGRMVHKEQNKRYKNISGSLENDIQTIQSERAKMLDDWDGKVENLPKAYTELTDKLAKLLETKEEKNARALKETLAKIRPMGVEDKKALGTHLAGSDSKVVKYIKKAYDMFPSDWVRKSINSGPIKIIKDDRGFFLPSEIGIPLKYGRGYAFSSAIHELGHRFEDVITGMLYEESKFYNNRTKGYQLEKLQDIFPNRGYDSNEYTRRDKFVDLYMGKDYGGTGFELTSLGFEYAFTNPEIFDKDPKMLQWLYGILVTL